MENLLLVLNIGFTPGRGRKEHKIAERNTNKDKITRAFKQNKSTKRGVICLTNAKKEVKYAHLSS